MSQSQYIGVYENRHAPTQKTKPYRVALKRYVNSKPEYTNIGYFNTEAAAAYVYNIYALNTFGKGAVINKLDITDDIEEELEEFIQEKAGIEVLVERAIELIEAHGHEIKTHDEVVRDS